MKRTLPLFAILLLLAAPYACRKNDKAPASPESPPRYRALDVGTVTVPDAGQHWTLAAQGVFPPRSLFTALNLFNVMYVVGGRIADANGTVANDVWFTQNGTAWAESTAHAAFSPRGELSGVVFNSTMYIMGGFNSDFTNNNDVWSSTTGATWNQVTAHAGWGARHHQSSVVFNNQIWVLCGNDGNAALNDVWSSSDGANWAFQGNAPFTGRENQTVIAFNGDLYVIGGVGAASPDVWASADGHSWSEVASSTAMGSRGGATGLVFDNRMWVLGGGGSDAWWSTDGVNWTAATLSAEYGSLRDAASTPFNGSMWLLGGDTGGNNFQSGVFFSPGLAPSASPTPTFNPSATPTPTPPATSTPTATESDTPPPTDTPQPTDTPTFTPAVSMTPTCPPENFDGCIGCEDELGKKLDGIEGELLALPATALAFCAGTGECDTPLTCGVCVTAHVALGEVGLMISLRAAQEVERQCRIVNNCDCPSL